MPGGVAAVASWATHRNFVRRSQRSTFRSNRVCRLCREMRVTLEKVGFLKVVPVWVSVAKVNCVCFSSLMFLFETVKVALSILVCVWTQRRAISKLRLIKQQQP